MEYVKLGRTGLEVSRICLGCMSYGVPDRGNHAWSIDEAESRPRAPRRGGAGCVPLFRRPAARALTGVLSCPVSPKRQNRASVGE
jgi:hypothetical protein